MLPHDQRWQQQQRQEAPTDHRMAVQLSATPNSHVPEATGALAANILISIIGVTILTTFICALLAAPPPLIPSPLSLSPAREDGRGGHD